MGRDHAGDAGVACLCVHVHVTTVQGAQVAEGTKDLF